MDKQDNIYMYIDNGELNIDKVADDFSGYLWSIINNSGINQNDEIKDIISDSYLILWKNQKKLDFNRVLSPYLVGIVKNLIKRYYYNFSDRFMENNIEDYENILLENDGIECIIEKKEINLKILNILNSLKSEDKDIFMSFYYEGRSIKEISIENNFSESKVKTKLHRIRNIIRKELLKGGYSING